MPATPSIHPKVAGMAASSPFSILLVSIVPDLGAVRAAAIASAISIVAGWFTPSNIRKAAKTVDELQDAVQDVLDNDTAK